MNKGNEDSPSERKYNGPETLRVHSREMSVATVPRQRFPPRDEQRGKGVWRHCVSEGSGSRQSLGGARGDNIHGGQVGKTPKFVMPITFCFSQSISRNLFTRYMHVSNSLGSQLFTETWK